MKKSTGAILLLALLSCRSMVGHPGLRLYEIENDRFLAGQQAIEKLKSARLILVGEHHTSKWHHEAQLAVIQALREAGRPVAVGLEMFRRDSQGDLNRWVAGSLQEAEFKSIYLDNWNLEWELYRPIFEYARKQKLAMVGLNVPRSISSQVARQGFNSLTDAQKQGLNSITCDVTDQYREFISQAYGAHAHGSLSFENFCEAQLMWDTVMANQAMEFIRRHPETTLVVLAGSGHARKPAIPAQLKKQGSAPVLVLLPKTDQIFEPGTVSSADADYLIISF